MYFNTPLTIQFNVVFNYEKDIYDIMLI